MTINEAIEMIEDKQPLFSGLLHKLVVVEDKDATPTLGTDGEYLFYNPEFLKTLTDEETCAVLLHEILHCAFLHQWRKGKKEQMRWNAAADYAINTIVNEEFALPKGCLLDTKYYGMAAEDIYEQLPKTKIVQVWCDKSSWDGKKGKNKKGNGKGLVEKIFGKKTKPGKSEDQKKSEWERAFKDSVLKNYGNAPDSIKRVIEKDYYIPTIDWSSLVASLLSEDTNDYTFSQPDRRFMEAEYILPAQSSIDRLKDVVFAYDTSGSISEEDLESYYVETLNLFNNFSSLQGWIAMCDSYLHSFKEVNPQHQSFKDFDFYGGGGTDFNPVFDEIRKKDMKPKAVFYFTDTEGSFPYEEPDYPVFWLVRSSVGDSFIPHVPFGRVIKFLAK